MRAGEMGIRLRKDQVEAIVRHAQEEYPNECCGLLAGKDGIVAEVYRATNVDHSPYTYLMDPAEQLKFFKEMEARGWELVGIYHSHTHSQAYPSRTDVEKAFYPEAVYVIVSLQDRQNPVIRAFRILDGKISEEDVEVHGE